MAGDGCQAVEAYSNWRPHFIWMDLRLPVIDGLEAARRIRMLEGGREVKIAGVTASAFASQREEVIAAGFDDFLRKPYRTREIFDCMARHLAVRYTYGRKQAPAAGHLPVTLRPEDLVDLPAALRDELETAVISLDAARIGLVVRRVTEQNASLGNALGRLAANLSYSAILRAVRRSKGHLTVASA
jgi:CheY-like chemotaxis protein